MALDYTLFNVFKRFNDYFTPDSNLFLDYCFWFLERRFNTLKTCFCKRTEKLETPRIHPWDITHVICVLDRPFDKDNPHFFEDVKVQIILTSEEDFETELNLCKEAGYKYGYVLYLPSEEIIPLEHVEEIM